MSAPQCRTCPRTLVARALWLRFPESERKRLSRTHASHGGHGLCGSCYNRVLESEGVEYRGGWERKGLILAPIGGRK